MGKVPDLVDKALKLALREYRERYPVGAIPAEIEKHACLTAVPERLGHRISICYWLKGNKDPLVFYEADVAQDGSVRVITAKTADCLIGQTFSEGAGMDVMK